MKTKVLLINLGTPDSTKLIDVARYLHEFLMDPKVIDLPWVARKALVSGIIVPFRTRKSAHAYKKIWNNGSPLLINSQAIAYNLQQNLGVNYEVRLAMRYGLPSIKNILTKLLATDTKELIVIPLFPQYSTAASGSAIAKFFHEIKHYPSLPKIQVINHWYNHPTYIELIASSIKAHLNNDTHLIISFHGIPVRQNVLACKKECSQACKKICNDDGQCYQAQCIATAKLIAKSLNLQDKDWSLAFQSRLGKIEWLKPYLNEHIADLYVRGVRKICVVSPGFVADCLETIEELGMRLQEDWQALGGTSFKLISCLNQENALILENIIKNS